MPRAMGYRNENLPVEMEDSNGCHEINVFIVNIHTVQLSPKGSI